MDFSPASTPLLTLQDELAPYRGHWHFQHCGSELLEAVHTTDYPGHGPECVIETRRLGNRKIARLFALHLILHGWAVKRLNDCGASLLISL
jgi:hypothetical protein